MRIYKLMICTIFLFTSVALSQTRTANIHRDDDFKFAVAVQKDWLPAETNSMETRLKLVRRGLEDLVDISIVATKPRSLQEWTSARFADEFDTNPDVLDELIRRGIPNSRLLESGKRKLSGQDAFYLKSRAMLGRGPERMALIVYQVLMFHEGNSFALTLRAPESEFDTIFPEFQRTANTFRLQSTVIKRPVRTTKSRRRS